MGWNQNDTLFNGRVERGGPSVTIASSRGCVLVFALLMVPILKVESPHNLGCRDIVPDYDQGIPCRRQSRFVDVVVGLNSRWIVPQFTLSSFFGA